MADRSERSDDALPVGYVAAESARIARDKERREVEEAKTASAPKTGGE